MASCHAPQRLSPLFPVETVRPAYSVKWLLVQDIPALKVPRQTCSQLRRWAQEVVGPVCSGLVLLQQLLGLAVPQAGKQQLKAPMLQPSAVVLARRHSAVLLLSLWRRLRGVRLLVARASWSLPLVLLLLPPAAAVDCCHSVTSHRLREARLMAALPACSCLLCLKRMAHQWILSGQPPGLCPRCCLTWLLANFLSRPALLPWGTQGLQLPSCMGNPAPSSCSMETQFMRTLQCSQARLRVAATLLGEVAKPDDGLARILPVEGTASHSVQGRSAQQPANAAVVLPAAGAAVSSVCAEAGRAEQPVDAPAAAGQLVSNAQQPANGPAAPGLPLSSHHRAASNEGMVTSAKRAAIWLTPGGPSWCSLRWLLMLAVVLMAILGALLWLPAPQASPIASSSPLSSSRQQVRHPLACLEIVLAAVALHRGSSPQLGGSCCSVQCLALASWTCRLDACRLQPRGTRASALRRSSLPLTLRSTLHWPFLHWS